MHGFLLMSDGRFDFLRLVAAARDGHAVGIVLRIFGVVMAEHDEHEIARLQARQIFCPQAFVNVSAAAAAASAFVVNVDLGGIEQRAEFIPHAPWAFITGRCAGSHDGIANEKQGRMERGIGRGGRRFLCGRARDG